MSDGFRAPLLPLALAVFLVPTGPPGFLSPLFVLGIGGETGTPPEPGEGGGEYLPTYRPRRRM